MEDSLRKQETQQPVTRVKLESLSTGELVNLADSYGIDIPSGLERIFVIEEILEYANAEESEPKEDLVVVPSYSESVLLPKQYNISYLDVMIRDPLWAFVFWEIKSHDRETHENAVDFKGYCIRVIPLIEGETEQQAKEKSFTVSVAPADSARYLGFAEHSSNSMVRYVIKLNAIRGDSEIQIASSRHFDLPALYEKDGISDLVKNPLIKFSGAQNLSIIKNTDRQPRIKR
ncbi:MAG: DUF4912 domain-containing protein [Treponema sp.]|nr:DUF4912 domain-containing protein [Treponema sp.]